MELLIMESLNAPPAIIHGLFQLPNILILLARKLIMKVALKKIMQLHVQSVMLLYFEF